MVEPPERERAELFTASNESNTQLHNITSGSVSHRQPSLVQEHTDSYDGHVLLPGPVNPDNKQFADENR